MSKSFSLVYSVASLASALTLTNSDGSAFTGTIPGSLTLTAVIGTPVSDGADFPTFTATVSVSGYDLTALGMDANSWSVTGVSADVASDMGEALLGSIFDGLSMTAHITFPSGMQGSAGGFLSFDDLATKYGLNSINYSDWANPNGSGSGSGGSGGPGGGMSAG